MQLDMPRKLAECYRNRSQQARVVSEAWAESQLYCANCASSFLRRAAPNTKAIDFTCPECQSIFQLKSQARGLSNRITDAAYEEMRKAILANQTPNLLVMHYDPSRWEVRNLMLVPRFAFSLSCLEKRKPLGPKARRHGWVGCNILLTHIPADARIGVVTEGFVSSPLAVRQQYSRLRPLEKLKVEARGWRLDVLNVVRRIGEREFSLGEVYAFGAELRRLHPQNLHVSDKIRQQLQRLRDMGFLEFLGRGRYRLT